MAESTVGWFGVREKYYSLADKPSEQAAGRVDALLVGMKMVRIFSDRI